MPQKQNETALSHLQAAARNNPKDAIAWHRLGVASNQHRQFAAAHAAYEKALSLQPDNVKILSNMGANLNDSGDYRQAETCLRKALAIEPIPIVKLNLAAALIGQGKRTEEVKTLAGKVLTDIDPAADRHSQIVCAAAYCQMAEAMTWESRVTEAAAHYRQAAVLNPESSTPYVGLGNLLIDEGKFAEAEGVLAKVPEQSPAYP